MSKIYICSPYRGNWAGAENDNPDRRRNIDYARAIANRVIEIDVEERIDLVAPHLYYTQFEISRERGQELARERLLECEAMIVGVKYGVSEGMQAEIDLAHKNGITVFTIIEPSELDLNNERL